MLIGLLSLAYQSHDNCVFLQSLLSTPVLSTHCFTALQKASQHVLNEDKTGIDAARLHYIVHATIPIKVNGSMEGSYGYRCTFPLSRKLRATNAF